MAKLLASALRKAKRGVKMTKDEESVLSICEPERYLKYLETIGAFV